MAKIDPALKAKILKRAETAQKDFSTFISFVWAFTPFKHQKVWIKELQAIADGDVKQLLLIAPRGAGKSAILVLFLAWMIGNNPTKHYGLISYADAVAWKRCRALRKIVEHSPEYHLIFPDIERGDSNWSRESFTVKRPDITDIHPTFMAAGSTAQVISSRLDGLVYDDPHDGKNSKTATKRRAVIETYDQDIKPCLVGGAWTACVATRYADDDLPGKFILRGFKKLHQKAIVETNDMKRKIYHIEHSYAPKLHTLAELRKDREENPAAFDLQMQGITRGSKASIIKKLTHYKPEDLPDLKDLLIGAGTDTNYKDTEAADYTVIYVCGMDVKHNVWVLHREKGRWDVNELADLFINLHTQWGYYNNWIEDTAKGTPAVTVVKKKAPYIPCELQPPSSGGKRSRASAIASYLNSGQVRFPVGIEWIQDAEHYLTGFPHVDHDDDVDALYMVLNNILHTIHPANYGKGRPEMRVTIGKPQQRVNRLFKKKRSVVQ